MNWLAFTLLAIISRSLYSIAAKLLSSRVKVSPITHAMLLTTSAGLLVFPVSGLFGGINFSGVSSVWFPSLMMVISQAFGNILFYQGMKFIQASTAQIAFSSILIWSLLLSQLFLGSNFSLLQLGGSLLMLLAILMVQYKKGGLRLDKGVLLIIASAALFAVFQVASAQISTAVNTGAYLLLAYFGSSLIIGTLYFKTIINNLKVLVVQIRSTFVLTAFISLSSLGYFLFSYFAYQIAPDKGVVVVLQTAQVILSVLLGILLLRERDNVVKKITAGFLAFVASVLIKS